MPLTKLEAELRPTARERIATGQLARDTPARIWAGKGTGQLCALCDKPIQRDEVEYEVEHHTDEVRRTFRFHIVCESVWKLECARADYLVKNP
jgi:hypothetical protein